MYQKTNHLGMIVVAAFLLMAGCKSDLSHQRRMTLQNVQALDSGSILECEEKFGEVFVSIADRYGDCHRFLVDHPGVSNKDALIELTSKKDDLATRPHVQDLIPLPDMSSAKVATADGAETIVIKHVMASPSGGISATETITCNLSFALGVDFPDFGKKGDHVWQVHRVSFGETTSIIWVNAETKKVHNIYPEPKITPIDPIPVAGQIISSSNWSKSDPGSGKVINETEAHWDVAFPIPDAVQGGEKPDHRIVRVSKKTLQAEELGTD